MRALPLVLVLLMAAPAAAQGPGPGPSRPREKPDASIRDGSAQRALDRARKRWRKAGIHNYRFTISRSCFCPIGDAPVIFVRDDRPVKVAAEWRSLATVRRLQRRVQEAIDQGVAGLVVRYDKRGIPREISIDQFANAADDEVSYGIEHFWRGTRGRGGPDMP
jgi:hypothetical protein